MRSPDRLLSVRDLAVGYGPIPVLRSVSLTVNEGEIVGLAGRNGAGKTTTLRAISGVVPRRRGMVEMRGKPLRAAPEAAARAGIAHVPEGRALMHSLSVLDNLRVAAYGANREITKDDLDGFVRVFPALAELLPRSAGSLSGGQQQMVAIARGLAAKPALLMVDELSLGLAPRITRELWKALVDLVLERQLGLLIVDQNLRLLATHCHKVLWLNEGEIRQIEFSEENSNKEISSIYFD